VKALHDFDRDVARLQGSEGRGGGAPAAGPTQPTVAQVHQQLGSLATTVATADSDPTPAMTTAFHDYCKQIDAITTQWNELLKTKLPALNQQLETQRLSALPAPEIAPSAACR
jgi:hypothetical protein